MALEGQVVDTQVGATTGGTKQPEADTSAAQTSTGSNTQATSQPAAKWEDDPRAKGMLADLQKERKARQDWERRAAEHEALFTERDRQLQAVIGNRTPSADEAVDRQIRERIEQMYPVLGKLTEAQLDKLMSVADRGDQFDTFTNAQWTRSNKQMIEGVYADIAKDVGELNDTQKRRINALYVSEAESNPEFLQRHEAGDPTLAKEFVKGYLADFVEPVRRKVTATEVNRARSVPFGKDRSIPGKTDKTIDVTDNKAVEDLLVAGFKERGGEFRSHR